MSQPHPLDNVKPPDPPKVPDSEGWGRREVLRMELGELAKKLEEYGDKVEGFVGKLGDADKSLRAQLFALSQEGKIKLSEFQKLNRSLKHKKDFLEKLEKYVKGWNYGALALESLFGETEQEREEARAKLGYTILKDVTPALKKYAQELKLLPKGLTAEQLITKLFGRAAILAIDAAEFPLAILSIVVDPSPTSDSDTMVGPKGYLTRQKQEECKKLVERGAPASKVNACMAEVLQLQRGILPQTHKIVPKPLTPQHSKKHEPLHITIHPLPQNVS